MAEVLGKNPLRPPNGEAEEVDIAYKITISGGRWNWWELREFPSDALAHALHRVGDIALRGRIIYGFLTSSVGNAEISEVFEEDE